LVRVQLTSVVIPGTRLKAIFKTTTISTFVSQVPRRLNQLLFGLVLGRLLVVFIIPRVKVPKGGWPTSSEAPAGILEAHQTTGCDAYDFI
jgi:hypothetical protein